MLYAILTGAIVFLVYLPTIWIRLVMRRYGAEISDMRGTGGELAEHLIGRFELEDIVVEKTTNRGDHFDPQDRAVRLGAKNYDGKSLAAIAVAAHEVGHAIQFSRKEPIFELRKKYIPVAFLLKRIGILIIALAPIIGVVVKSPTAIFAIIGLSLVLQLLGALAYLIVLPEEWDASFNKALPILLEGEYIRPDQLTAVRSVLKAAALTYLAGALADVINIGRWLLILRR